MLLKEISIGHSVSLQANDYKAFVLQIPPTVRTGEASFQNYGQQRQMVYDAHDFVNDYMNWHRITDSKFTVFRTSLRHKSVLEVVHIVEKAILEYGKEQHTPLRTGGTDQFMRNVTENADSALRLIVTRVPIVGVMPRTSKLDPENPSEIYITVLIGIGA